MREESVNRESDEWWATLEPVKRVLFRSLIRLAWRLLEGEVLRVNFTGRSFVPALRSLRCSMIHPGGSEETFKPTVVESQVWWARLSAPERLFVMELAGVFQLLKRDRNEYLEIRRTARGLQATRLMRLRGAVGGKPLMN